MDGPAKASGAQGSSASVYPFPLAGSWGLDQVAFTALCLSFLTRRCISLAFKKRQRLMSVVSKSDDPRVSLRWSPVQCQVTGRLLVWSEAHDLCFPTFPRADWVFGGWVMQRTRTQTAGELCCTVRRQET